MSKGVAFGKLRTVALALATGEATMPIPQSVKVTKGTLKDHMDFRDVDMPPRRRCSLIWWACSRAR